MFREIVFYFLNKVGLRNDNIYEQRKKVLNKNKIYTGKINSGLDMEDIFLHQTVVGGIDSRKCSNNILPLTEFIPIEFFGVGMEFVDKIINKEETKGIYVSKKEEIPKMQVIVGNLTRELLKEYSEIYIDFFVKKDMDYFDFLVLEEKEVGINENTICIYREGEEFYYE